MNEQRARLIAIIAIILSILTIIFTMIWALSPENRGIESTPAITTAPDIVYCLDRPTLEGNWNGCDEGAVELSPSEYCYNKELYEIPNSSEFRYCD